jgi:hypothetical protein
MPFAIDVIKIKNCEKQPLLPASPGRVAATMQYITIHSALGVAIGIKQQSARKIRSNKHQVMRYLRNAAEASPFGGTPVSIQLPTVVISHQTLSFSHPYI